MNELNITLTPVSLALYFGGVACVVALFLRRKREGALMAKYLVENQNQPASEEDLDAYLKLAEAEGKRVEFLRELSAIRRVFGPAGVKLGHLTWIDLKLEGKLPQDAVAPAFI